MSLNIGGRRFSISKRTIIENFEDSYFNKMLKGKAPIIKDKNKDIFIDRNGYLFPYVIDYIQNRKILNASDL